MLGSLGRKLGGSSLMFPSFEPILNQVSKKRKKYLVVTETHEVIIVRGRGDAVRTAAATAVTPAVNADCSGESKRASASAEEGETETCHIEKAVSSA